MYGGPVIEECVSDRGTGREMGAVRVCSIPDANLIRGGTEMSLALQEGLEHGTREESILEGTTHGENGLQG